MANRGYHSYRGRHAGRKHVLVALLILILLLAFGILFFQKFITYSDDGKMHLELPLPWQDKEDAPPREPDDLHLIIDEPEKPAPQEPEEELRPAYGEHRLLNIDVLPGDVASLSKALNAVGADGFVYTVKNNAGQVFLHAPSALGSAVAETAPSTELVTAMCELENVTSVARINCFHDSYYAWANMESAGICQSTGYIWYDNLSYHWLDPAKEAARSYIIGLALDCAQMGFDEILLEEVSYPVRGKLSKIDYSGNTLGKTDALELFLQELRAALEPYDVRVSLMLDGTLLEPETGADYAETSGLQLSRLAANADAVFVPTNAPLETETALAALCGDDVPPFVPMTAQPPEEGSWCLVLQ